MINLEKVKEKMVKIFKKDSKGLYIEQSSINKNFDQDEINFILNLQKEGKFRIVNDVTTKKDRSPLVRDMDYGKYQDMQERDISDIAKFEYDINGNLVFENYDELDKFLEEQFIPENVVMMKKRKSEDSEGNLYPFIQLNKITKLRLSDLEVKHAMEYLKSRGITVRGIDSSIDQEFDNYDYYRTYKNQMLPHELTSDETLQKLAIYQATKDPFIREQIILGNLRLVPYIAYKYGIMYGIDSKLLESYGYEGLIMSLDKIDLSLGYKFSTFAVAHIKGYIKKGVEEMMTEYAKRSVWNSDYLRCKKIVEDAKGEKLEDNLDLAVDITKLMIRDGSISEENFNHNINRIKLICSESIDELMQQDEELSKDEKYYDDKVDEVDQYESSVESLMIDESQEFNGKVDNNLLRDALDKTLSTLKPIEEKVLRLRFGIDDGRSRTFADVGLIFNVSRERIRQIEAKALRKLRHPSRAKQIRDFLIDDQPTIGHK